MEALDLTATPVVLDPAVPAERIPEIAALVLMPLLLGVPLFAGEYPGQPVWAAGAHTLVLVVVFLVVAKTRRVDLVLQGESRRLARRTRFLGKQSVQDLAGFDEVAAVGVQCLRHHTKNRSWFEYRLVLVLGDGSLVPVTDDDQDPVTADREAARLAEFLGCPAVPAAEGRRLTVTPQEGGPPTITQDAVDGPLVPYGGQGVVGPALGLALASLAASFGLAKLY